MENFYGNAAAAATLEQMLASGRIPQTILLHGPPGVGKATLARRFASRVLGPDPRIEQDDLSLPANIASITEREKWTADKRNDDPLVFASYPDFVTFAPDGPLRQLSIQQMRLLKERAPFAPLKGSRRVFLIDQIDRANEQAANSLLKTLEEPPQHLILVLTAQNQYDLLPTIRSRAVLIPLRALTAAEVRGFIASRGLDSPERRAALAGGSPGTAVTLDIAAYDKRRAAMLALLETAARQADFSTWARQSEALNASRSEKLEGYLDVLYVLLEDLLLLTHGTGPLKNPDVQRQLQAIASHVSFDWLREALRRTDELIMLLRRNIQKSTALDALVVGLRQH